MATYRSPGVYVEEIPVFPPSVAEVETAIPAFIGYTQKATDMQGNELTNVAFRINGFDEFEQYYGTPPGEDPAVFEVTVTEYKQGDKTLRYVIEVTREKGTVKLSPHILHPSMKLYFANGGGPCYIVSVGTGLPGTLDKKALKDGIAVVASEDIPTLLVVPEAANFTNISDFGEVIGALITQASDLKDRFAIVDVPSPTAPKDSTGIRLDAKNFRDNSPTDNLLRRYSAAYYPYLETSYTYNDNSDFATNKFKAIKIKAHSVSVDGAAPTDGPFKGQTIDDVKTANELLYNRIKDEFNKLHLVLPPSAAIAGAYVRVDESRGVWKAPANVGLANVVKAVSNISRSDRDDFNITDTGKSINAIVNIPDYGTQIFGGRTLDGNDNEWRYINVRRFVSVVEESIQKSINWAVFEPNTAPTWVRVQAMIESYLFLKWRDGALAGAKPEQAYDVQVGLNKTMTSDDVLNGLMIIEIKLAVSRPAEFIILRIMQKAQES